MRREASPDPPRAKSPLSRRGREETKMHLSPPRLESGAGRRRRPEVPALPLQERAPCLLSSPLEVAIPEAN